MKSAVSQGQALTDPLLTRAQHERKGIGLAIARLACLVSLNDATPNRRIPEAADH